jgi:FMN phosphatase YigB (HAD superfamily)
MLIDPDQRIFEAAATAGESPPTRCLMVSDHPEADTGALPLGMTTLLLPMSRPGASTV